MQCQHVRIFLTTIKEFFPLICFFKNVLSKGNAQGWPTPTLMTHCNESTVDIFHTHNHNSDTTFESEQHIEF